MQISRVLIVLNKIKDSNIVLQKGFEVANKFKANVEVLFVYEKPLFDIEELYKDKTVDKKAITNKLKEQIATIASKDTAVFVKIDDTPDRIWDLIKDDTDTLIVAQYSSDTTANILSVCKQPLYVVKTKQAIQKSALYFEETESIENCINLANNFGNIELFYNLAYMPNIDPIDPTMGGNFYENELLIESQKEIFTNLKEVYDLSGEMFINSRRDGEYFVDYFNNSSFDLVLFCNIKDSFIDVSILADALKIDNKDLLIIKD